MSGRLEQAMLFITDQAKIVMGGTVVRIGQDGLFESISRRIQFAPLKVFHALLLVVARLTRLYRKSVRLDGGGMGAKATGQARNQRR